MKVEFTEIIKSEVEIDFQKVFNFIKIELETAYNKSISKELIYINTLGTNNLIVTI